MCGIAGVFRRAGIRPSDVELIEQMNNLQKHRGPDDSGVFSDQLCVLGHRRLAIIDLSSDGHQPFESDDHRFQLIYNGELYNYIELREELRQLGWQFRTKTDTEVLLKAYQQYGHDCLCKFNGMFAFAIYDTKENILFLARDRIGIKPLYFLFHDSSLFFASEIKALFAIPDLDLRINYQSLFDYLVFNRTDIFDETFFKEISRIPKGHYAFYDTNGFRLFQWWNPESFLDTMPHETLPQIKNKIQDIMISSVQLRMRSDVPVGSCLSGGLDSSILIGILFNCKWADNGYPTFTASFPKHPIDETHYIDNLNTKYSFKNIRTYPTAKKAYEKLKQFVYTNDEPTTNYSFFSQYEVMRLANEHGITVLLDGQGGDESFAGYHYFHGFNLYGQYKNKRILSFFQELLKSYIKKQDKSAYQTLLFQLAPDVVKKYLLLKTLSYLNADFFYSNIEKSIIFNEFFNADSLNKSLVRHFQYKLEHLLRMEDRNSMAFSIEARVPYLDYRLIEYVLGIPGALKINRGETKYLQKIVLGKFTTKEILNRIDKVGFGTPGDEWMQTDIWQEISLANYSKLLSEFPEVFKKIEHLPAGGFDLWKINQLATWHNLFFP